MKVALKLLEKLNDCCSEVGHLQLTSVSQMDVIHGKHGLYQRCSCSPDNRCTSIKGITLWLPRIEHLSKA